MATPEWEQDAAAFAEEHLAKRASRADAQAEIVRAVAVALKAYEWNRDSRPFERLVHTQGIDVIDEALQEAAEALLLVEADLPF
jgi:hypothetical protein